MSNDKLVPGEGGSDDDVFPPECDARTRKWLSRLAKATLTFLQPPVDYATGTQANVHTIAYSVACRVGDDPADPMSGWAIRLCEIGTERVGGHRDGEVVSNGMLFHVSGLVSWLYEKQYRDILVVLDTGARRQDDGVPVPHIRVSGCKKSGRPFCIMVYTTPYPDVPTFKVKEG